MNSTQIDLLQAIARLKEDIARAENKVAHSRNIVANNLRIIRRKKVRWDKLSAKLKAITEKD